MDANANPSFEVATIKPSKPDERSQYITIQGRRMVIVNQSLGGLLSFAYCVHAKQIIGAPAWVETDKYDVTTEPDGEGMPSDKQWRTSCRSSGRRGRRRVRRLWVPGRGRFARCGRGSIHRIRRSLARAA
jgi:hypothetical protein